MPMRRRGRIGHHRSIEYIEEEAELPAGTAFDINFDQARRTVTASGACPACGGHTSTEFSYGIGGAGTKGRHPQDPMTPTPAIPEATIYCECGHAHPGRPTNALDVGCGRFWQVDVSAVP
jgi:hypothetical protein